MSQATAIAELIEHLSRRIQGAAYAHDLKPAQWSALRYYARADRTARTIRAFAGVHASSHSAASQIVTAAGGSGQITFSAGAPYPCSIGVSATLFFPPGTFHPQSETLQNAAVPIDGACGSVDAGSD